MKTGFCGEYLGPKGTRMGSGEGSSMREELLTLYRSPYIVSVTKCRKLRWADHVVRKKAGRIALKIVTGKPKGHY